jgi:hypothetical protein
MLSSGPGLASKLILIGMPVVLLGMWILSMLPICLTWMTLKEKNTGYCQKLIRKRDESVFLSEFINKIPSSSYKVLLRVGSSKHKSRQSIPTRNHFIEALVKGFLA